MSCVQGVQVERDIKVARDVVQRYENHGGYTWQTDNKVIVIIGASSGIGEHLAYQLASSSSRLTLILCARRRPALEHVAAECKKQALDTHSTRIQVEPVDIADPSQVQALMQKLKQQHQRIDALILNAGVSMGETLDELGEQEAIRILHTMTDINYKGLIACAIHAVPLLKAAAKPSRVVVVSSMLGFAAGPSRSLYCASKFGLLGFFDAFRSEYQSEGVTVTMVYPGRVATDLNRTRLGRNPAQFDAKKSMSAEKAASIVLEAVQKPWVRDVAFGVHGKLLHWIKGCFSDVGDFVMAFFITRIQKKKVGGGSEGDKKVE